jgi:tripartite-type tricarboxylate transporter receptor subunit TctC
MRVRKIPALLIKAPTLRQNPGHGREHDTSRSVVDKLAVAARQAMQMPAAIETLRKQGDDPLDAGPDEFADFMQSEIARWREVARAA